MNATNTKKRGNWNEDNLQKALEAIRTNKMSDYKASVRFGVPRRTLRRYIRSGANIKAKLGRKFTLSEQEKDELCGRIVRLAEVGYPITSKILRLCVYKYCKNNNLKHQFSNIKQVASHKWARQFLRDNPGISIRKSQNLNPARAQKLNKFIVDDHFKKIKQVFEANDIFNKPERLFNMDEKGCRLNLHKEPKVLAKKGARRVHIIGNEHGENVTIVSCANAIGSVIPPMILFKGKRMKDEFADDLPPGSVCRMTERGSMTTKCFVDWLQHFSQYKPPGPCVLIFDGAKCHLDYEIVETAEQHDIVLYCLPSNTTHELQPLDKAVFRSFEYHWDQQLMLFWHNHGERMLTKQRFGKVFTPVWDRALTPSNVKSGFRATGLYPYNPDAIPETAFQPSTASNIPIPENEEPLEKPQAASTPVLSTSIKETFPQAGPSGLSNRKRTGVKILPIEEKDAVEDALLNCNSDSSAEESESEANRSKFSDLLPTPIKSTPKNSTKRQKAINSRAVVLKKSTFNGDQKTNQVEIKKPIKKISRTSSNKKEKKTASSESWYCNICKEDEVKDMRMCVSCASYIHEECVGLTKHDTEVFICPNCQV